MIFEAFYRIGNFLYDKNARIIELTHQMDIQALQRRKYTDLYKANQQLK